MNGITNFERVREVLLRVPHGLPHPLTESCWCSLFSYLFITYSRDYSLRVFFFGDIEFLTKIYGLSGSSGKQHVCLILKLHFKIILVNCYNSQYRQAHYVTMFFYFFYFFINRAALLSSLHYYCSRKQIATLSTCQHPTTHTRIFECRFPTILCSWWRHCKGKDLQQCDCPAFVWYSHWPGTHVVFWLSRYILIK